MLLQFAVTLLNSLFAQCVVLQRVLHVACVRQQFGGVGGFADGFFQQGAAFVAVAEVFGDAVASFGFFFGVKASVGGFVIQRGGFVGVACGYPAFATLT